ARRSRSTPGTITPPGETSREETATVRVAVERARATASPHPAPRNRQLSSMADDESELSEDDVERAVRAARDSRAIAAELSIRFARPDERVDVGRRIDPATAHVFLVNAQTLDPYGDDPDLPEEMEQIGRVYFAVDPNEGVAVAFYDLPDGTREALEDKRRSADREGWRRLLDEE